MSNTENLESQVATRDKERTRRALIDAAAQLFAEEGAGVSLAVISTRAGVSKGALTHHFPNRSDLEMAMLEDVAQRFWDEVHAHVDLSENRPGKLMRAYVRTLTTQNEVVKQIFSPMSLMQVLGSKQPTSELLERDAAMWREAFAADGLDTQTMLTVRFAAEGLAGSVGSCYVTADELAVARRRLLELTEG